MESLCCLQALIGAKVKTICKIETSDSKSFALQFEINSTQYPNLIQELIDFTMKTAEINHLEVGQAVEGENSKCKFHVSRFQDKYVLEFSTLPSKGEESDMYCDVHEDINLQHDGDGGLYCAECDEESGYHE